MSVADKSIFVDNLVPPLSSTDIAGYFSKAGSVDKVVIPDVDGQAAIVVFVKEQTVQIALAFNGKNFRDATIVVKVPNESQLWLLEPQDEASGGSVVENLKTAFSQMDTSDMLSLLQELTLLANAKSKPDRAGAAGLGSTFVKSNPDRVGDVGSGSTVKPSGSVVGINPSGTLPPQPGITPFVATQYPKLAFFSGDGTKGEVLYWQWRNEVMSLVSEGYNHSCIMQGVRRSLRGTAAEVFQNLGNQVSIPDLAEKLDIVFGVVVSAETLLGDFYNSSQRVDEKVVIWGCRLESLLARIIEQGLDADTHQMMRTRFWHGLCDSSIKHALRHRFDHGESYQELLTAARAVEHESRNCPQSVSLKTQSTIIGMSEVKHGSVSTNTSTGFEDQLKLINKQLGAMQKEIALLKKSEQPKTQPQSSPDVHVECFYCHDIGHFIRDCPKLANKNQKINQSKNYR